MATDREKRELAEACKARLAKEPTLTVNLLASALDATVQDVQVVLDEWRPTDNGVEHVGPGGGGPWVEPAPLAEG